MTRYWMVCLALMSALAACGSITQPAGSRFSSAQPVSVGRVRLASNGALPNTVFVWLTQDAGIFAQHGLQVDIAGMNGQASMNSMVAGNAEAVVHGGAQLILSAAANGTPLKIVAVMSPVYDLVLVVPNDITTPDQLRGKTVGATSGTSVNALGAKRIMAKYGFELGKDYKLVETGTNGSEVGMVAQLVSHQVDIIAVQEDVAGPALASGQFHVLVDLAKTEGLPVASQSLVVRSDWAGQHADAVQALVDSFIDGVRLLRQNPEAVRAPYKAHYSLTDPIRQDAITARLADILAKTPTVNKAEFTDIVANMPKNGPQISDGLLDAMLDNHFVENATARGLTNY